MKTEQALKVIKQALELAIKSGKIETLEDTAVLLQAFDTIVKSTKNDE